jgi:transcriptional regulator with XRE-family HTH domain
MSHGYSLRFVALNRSADVELLGVKLGRRCIDSDVSVTAVAERLGVSRQTVYNWFIGQARPRSSARKRIELFLATL